MLTVVLIRFAVRCILALLLMGGILLIIVMTTLSSFVTATPQKPADSRATGAPPADVKVAAVSKPPTRGEADRAMYGESFETYAQTQVRFLEGMGAPREEIKPWKPPYEPNPQ